MEPAACHLITSPERSSFAFQPNRLVFPHHPHNSPSPPSFHCLAGRPDQNSLGKTRQDKTTATVTQQKKITEKSHTVPGWPAFDPREPLCRSPSSRTTLPPKTAPLRARSFRPVQHHQPEFSRCPSPLLYQYRTAYSSLSSHWGYTLVAFVSFRSSPVLLLTTAISTHPPIPHPKTHRDAHTCTFVQPTISLFLDHLTR